MIKLKKWLSMMLIIVFISTSTTVYAASSISSSMTEKELKQLLSQNNYAFENEYIKLYIDKVMHEVVSIQKVLPIKDLSENYTYLYFQLNNGSTEGYAILNLKDLSIPECAMDHTIPFDIDNTMIYCGPLAYYEINNGHYFDKRSGQKLAIDNINGLQYNTFTLTSREKISKYMDLQSMDRSVVKTIPGAGNTAWLFNAGNINDTLLADCGVNAMAMTLKYYDLYVNSNYLPSNVSTENAIKTSIMNYLGLTDATHVPESLFAQYLTQYSTYIGVNGYYLYASNQSYSWSATVNKLDSNRPMPMSIKNHPVYHYHYVIACGYTDTGDLGTSRLYINTGWSSHGFVWIDQSYAYRQIPCV